MTVPVILGLTSEGTDDRLGHPRTSRMLVRTQAPHFKFLSSSEVRMTVSVILGRAGRSSIPPIQFAYTSITPRILSPKIQLYPMCESG